MLIWWIYQRHLTPQHARSLGQNLGSIRDSRLLEIWKTWLPRTTDTKGQVSQPPEVRHSATAGYTTGKTDLFVCIFTQACPSERACVVHWKWFEASITFTGAFKGGGRLSDVLGVWTFATWEGPAPPAVSPTSGEKGRTPPPPHTHTHTPTDRPWVWSWKGEHSLQEQQAEH